MEQTLVLRPSEFVDVFNQTLDYAYPRIVIEGEISSFRVAKNKWLYFDIKDETATIRCFGTVYMLPGPLEDGMQVQIVCTPRLHPLYNFSLQISSIIPKGEGAIARAAELLFKKLESEGLFLPERKRPLPYAPEKIALITSSESAAYADFVKIANARWPLMAIDVFSTLVQGNEAPTQIVRAIEQANSSATNYDALVVIRGGGSAEDLSAFNDERIVRALAGSRIQTLVAIGHEVDESLAELVADLRASTPSNAAELLTPDINEEFARLHAYQTRLLAYLEGISTEARQYYSDAHDRFLRSIDALVYREKMWIGVASSRLRLLDPRQVLARGYALLKKGEKVVSSKSELGRGTEIAILLKDGQVKAKVV